MSNLGIFGGSFNPIHMGHLIIAEHLIDEFKLDKILFVVSYEPPHKRDSSAIAPAEHRAQMTALAIGDNPRFQLSKIEFVPEQSSYTVKVLRTLNNKYPHASLSLIIGADSLLELHTWYQWERLWDEADRIIVTPRPGYPADKVSGNLRRRVNISNSPLIDIAASTVRARVSEGKSIKYLVPPAVEAYVNEHLLYHK